MKVNEYYIDAINADKVLDILKTSIEPKDNPRLNLTKIRSPYNVAYKIDYTAYVSKEEYKQIKAIATNETSTDNETNSPNFAGLPENVKDALEKQCAIFFAIANHEDCEE
ncbi:hypothetical protein ACMWD3_04910 [Gardnerella swidsinskii]|jgi:hypothetical protein|uniref:hypothetical protein n=1 Tax=Gardnerella TaxID=2701 RepID=UPI0001C21F23|nr:hypothetical protein [uncultured Gardnerella sp.]ADB14385.1 hypothetical protein HMPREF0424_0969 [Gardnerella vaginalis 409-05]RIY25849.1 hypothetical protein CJI51_04290 [Bifidobacteriaceae bacterium WP021]DAM68128.1 MAG TPA: hypothetical protein [Caudoviricetes sp.]